MWPLFPCEQRQSWDLPIPVQGVSVCAWGLRPRREQTPLALSMRPLLPSASSHYVGSLDFNRIPRLHTQPARAPVNASLRPLRSSAHDSGLMWFATPSSYDSFIHDTSPVFIGALGTLVQMQHNHIFSIQQAYQWQHTIKYATPSSHAEIISDESGFDKELTS